MNVPAFPRHTPSENTQLAIIVESNIKFHEDYENVVWFITVALADGTRADLNQNYDDAYTALGTWQCDQNDVKGKACYVTVNSGIVTYDGPFRP